MTQTYHRPTTKSREYFSCRVTPIDTGISLERGLPASIEAERAILGAVLLDNTLWPQAASTLVADHFSLDGHRRIYAAMRQMDEKGIPFDMITLAEELDRRKEVDAVGGIAYLSSLIDGVPERPSIEHYVRIVQNKALLRGLINVAQAAIAEAIEHSDEAGGVLGRAEQSIRQLSNASVAKTAIRTFTDVPDLLELPAKEPQWILDGLLPQGSVTLLSGSDGVGKSHVSLALAVAVAEGGSFLGRACIQSAVLVLDHENPIFETQGRLARAASGKNGLLRIWGNWLPDTVPQLGDPRLLEMRKTVQPLMMVIDCLTFAHSADENSASEMVEVMRHLRAYAACGTCVLLLHHVSKAEGSAFRGSSAIRAACDIGITQEITDEGVLTLKVNKNRFGRKFTMTAQADFAGGTFELIESQAMVQRRDNKAEIAKLIAEKPGLNKTEVCRECRMRIATATEILDKGDGVLWRSEAGRGRSRLYYSLVPNAPILPILPGTSGNVCTSISNFPIIPDSIRVGMGRIERDTSAEGKDITLDGPGGLQ